MSQSPPQLRIVLLLGIASVLAIALLFPYLLSLYLSGLALVLTRVPLPVPIVAQSLQAGVLCFLLAWAGLKFGDSLGLRAPWLARRSPISRMRHRVGRDCWRPHTEPSSKKSNCAFS